MTLIAVRVEDDAAEILTDSLAYDLLEFYPCSKIDAFPHIDAVVTGRGVTRLVEDWRRYVDAAFQVYADFDDLLDLAQDLLPQMWANLQPTIEALPLMGGIRTAEVLQVGWSPSRQRFIAVVFTSEEGFAARSIGDGFWSAPSLAAGPAVLPTSDHAWVEVAEAIYEEGGFGLDSRSPMGGDIFLARLERGNITHRRIHRIPDDDWRYRQMSIGSFHRFGQLGPCACGSGEPYVRCHLKPPPTWPCPCGSGAVFFDCHRVTEAEVNEHLARHPDDFTRTQADLRALWVAPVPAALPTNRQAGGPPPAQQQRNEPCACQSGRKYKRCCGTPTGATR